MIVPQVDQVLVLEIEVRPTIDPDSRHQCRTRLAAFRGRQGTPTTSSSITTLPLIIATMFTRLLLVGLVVATPILYSDVPELGKSHRVGEVTQVKRFSRIYDNVYPPPASRISCGDTYPLL
ncbi:hypothetical protein J6590_045981 [Homalodisca vitripennis]|nr:hypothetical protein J6590_045981 [Homalodisca vitripennis]